MSKTFLFSLILAIAACCLTSSCGMSTKEKLATASEIVGQRADSALILLNDIDPTTLQDGEKAEYIVTKAIADIGNYRSLVTDSLLPFAISYYKASGDTLEWLKANRLYISYLHTRDRAKEAVCVIDSVIAAIPADSIDWQYELRGIRMKMNAIAGDYQKAIDEADWLIYHTRFDEVRFYHSYLKMVWLYFAGRNMEASAWGDSITRADYMTDTNSDKWLDFMGDYAEILDESGKSAQAIAIVEDILRRNPDSTPDFKVGFLVSLAKYNANIGNISLAKQYLAIVDTLDFNPANIDNDYENYLAYLNGAIRFKETGRLSGVPNKKIVNELNQQRRVNKDAIMEMNTLSARKAQLTTEKQRLWIIVLVVPLALLTIASLAGWLLRQRRARLLEAEEKIDTLDNMLRQVKRSESGDKNAMLKKMVLQQMGILKTFASAPTTQNQEVLKKISSIGNNEASGNLVDWPTLYDMIDELFDNFHSKLLRHYPDTFTDKEMQIICLLRADFSTKEIGILTEQSSATVYVRKSAIRKKLRTPQAADFITQIEESFQLR